MDRRDRWAGHRRGRTSGRTVRRGRARAPLALLPRRVGVRAGATTGQGEPRRGRSARWRAWRGAQRTLSGAQRRPVVRAPLGRSCELQLRAGRPRAALDRRRREKCRAGAGPAGARAANKLDGRIGGRKQFARPKFKSTDQNFYFDSPPPKGPHQAQPRTGPKRRLSNHSTGPISLPHHRAATG